MNPRAFAIGTLLFAAACRRQQPVRTIVVMVTATPAPIVAVDPTETPIVESAEFAFPVVEPTEIRQPPVTPIEIAGSAFEPRRDPTPASLHEQMVRCLSFEAEKDQRAVTSDMYQSVYARVKARNSCDTSLPGEQLWVEVRAIIPVGGRGLIAQEYGRFQGPVPPRATAETTVRIMGEGIEPTQFYRFEVSLWPEAGTGRRPD